jgi:hypothetical protein
MKHSIKKAVLASALLASVSTVNAGIINFIGLTETGGYGESAWTNLNLSSSGVNLAISGHASNDNDNQQYAYLDWGRAGLGVCKDTVTPANVDKKNPGSGANNCAPSNDDNVTSTEYLRFIFDSSVTVTRIWFNNNHDGGFDASDKVDINGNIFTVKTGYANTANGIGSFNVAANTAFDLKYFNEEFYVSAIEFEKLNVPEPSAILLFCLGFLGLLGTRKVKR